MYTIHTKIPVLLWYDSARMKTGNHQLKTQRRHIHLTIDPDVHRLAKVQAARWDMDLSHAVEELLKLWVGGKIKLQVERKS